MNNTENALVVTNLVKSFHDVSGNVTPVLRGVTFSVRKGELVAVIGSSGSGKSTMLQIVGGLDNADSGEVIVAGKNLASMNEKEKGLFRNRTLGFVYQFHHLLPELTALENVAMPLLIRRTDKKEAFATAKAALEAVGLGERLAHLPSQLSGGERQRTAIARAVVTRPACILADEPTGNLDRDTAHAVFDGLLALAHEAGTALVIVTHDTEIASRCDRSLHLVNGVITDPVAPEAP